MSKYAKFWTAIATAVAVSALTALTQAMGDGAITSAEWVNVALVAVVAFGGAAGVYAIPNEPMD